jgi:hypothetical protein
MIFEHHVSCCETFGNALTSNFHKLLHVSEMIRRGGPIHEFSVCCLVFIISSYAQCAVYERTQAKLNKQSVSAHFAPEQLIRNSWRRKALYVSEHKVSDNLLEGTSKALKDILGRGESSKATSEPRQPVIEYLRQRQEGLFFCRPGSNLPSKMKVNNVMFKLQTPNQVRVMQLTVMVDCSGCLLCSR